MKKPDTKSTYLLFHLYEVKTKSKMIKIRNLSSGDKKIDSKGIQEQFLRCSLSLLITYVCTIVNNH